MRKVMICVSVMLALLQFWPMVFGHRSVADVASPGAQAAVVIPVPKRVAAVSLAPAPAPIKASASKGSAPSSCFVQYRAKFAACAKGDTACGAKVADQWDLCEATGFWPD